MWEYCISCISSLTYDSKPHVWRWLGLVLLHRAYITCFKKDSWSASIQRGPSKGWWISMKRQMLSLFLTLLALISVGGAVSIVGAASHVTSAHTSNLTVKAESCPFVGCKCSGTYHYADCYWASIIKPEKRVCFNNPCDAQAAGYQPCEHCHPLVCWFVVR